jgi:hydrogenase 3 maturation protease
MENHVHMAFLLKTASLYLPPSESDTMKNPITLYSILALQPGIIGIGNELRGDDGAGVEIVSKLLDMGYPHALAVYDTPENYLQKIVAMDVKSRLWVDVINWESIPGKYRIFLPHEIHHFAISTHNYSPTVLLEFLKPLKPLPDYFLGIQPLNMSLGAKISDVVQATIDDIISITKRILNLNNFDREIKPGD